MRNIKDLLTKNLIENLRIFIIVFLVIALIFVSIAPKSIFQQIKGGITGAATSSVFIFEIFNNKTCNATLVEGWNLATMPCNPANKSVAFVLSSIGGKYISVHWYDQNDNSDRWKTYNPSLPSWVMQDLTNISIERGYWIRTNQSNVYWTLNGNITLPNYIILQNGWNLAGYSTNETRDIAFITKGINNSLGSIHMYNASDTLDPWKVYKPSIDPSFNDLNALVPHFGYWINISTNTSVNWTII